MLRNRVQFQFEEGAVHHLAKPISYWRAFSVDIQAYLPTKMGSALD